jgi:ubiquinone/menaquinone biosynthesis C-methylase UbiE
MATMIKLTTRSDNLLPLFDKYLHGSARVLNLGSGDGLLSEELRSKPQDGKPIKVIDIDLINRTRTAQRPILYDGREIPFSDNFFDATLGMYVLHHSPDPDQLITEMKRVTSGHIVIVEDLAETPWDAVVCLYHGIRYSEWARDRVKLSRRKLQQWVQACAAQGLTLVDSMRLPRFSRLTGRTYPVTRAVLVFKAVNRCEMDTLVA